MNQIVLFPTLLQLVVAVSTYSLNHHNTFDKKVNRQEGVNQNVTEWQYYKLENILIARLEMLAYGKFY